jgi:hypothetical protein
MHYFTRTPTRWANTTPLPAAAHNEVVGTGGLMAVTNFGAATQPMRFYRLPLVP